MLIHPPDQITLHHDDYHASHIGRTTNGRQFFLTTPFVPSVDEGHTGKEFVALYIFDPTGTLIEAHIEYIGTRARVDDQLVQAAFEKLLATLGPVTYGTIRIRPFQIKQFNTVFGLVIHQPQDTNDEVYVSVEPGNYMAFHAPWDSGEYDT